jgi:hypothetical protein
MLDELLAGVAETPNRRERNVHVDLPGRLAFSYQLSYQKDRPESCRLIADRYSTHVRRVLRPGSHPDDVEGEGMNITVRLIEMRNRRP